MKISENLTFIYFISVSLIGLFFLPIMVFKIPASATSHWHQLPIFSVFGLICFLGILAGIFPSKFQKKGNKIMEFKGHHPDCGNFSEHVIQVGDKIYCAGCSGLVIGAVISLFGVLLYLIGRLPCENMTIIFWLGFTGTLTCLLYNSLFKWRISFLNLFLNAFFVLGAFMLLIGMEKINNSLLIELYLLILIPIWIITRILSSQKAHRRICEICDLKKCQKNIKE
ncbi:hypothetical protein [Methanothermobacter tenebrarum]|uniref:DUF2085 domain-containing protein n=1 Tax=Methanothermobacter tenebrarum TaxID=680118 RepID=A0A328P8V1_9EURY|nr:hypothetical protein [Methanothermobacter tenebrarum]NPV65085.1 hypothetical protein [Methanobacteriaceae archaeon]RAO78459.1 hypothetical protein DPC56_07975 [Methanothermobacter tenebrarum]